MQYNALSAFQNLNYTNSLIHKISQFSATWEKTFLQHFIKFADITKKSSYINFLEKENFTPLQ